MQHRHCFLVGALFALLHDMEWRGWPQKLYSLTFSNSLIFSCTAESTGQWVATLAHLQVTQHGLTVWQALNFLLNSIQHRLLFPPRAMLLFASNPSPFFTTMLSALCALLVITQTFIYVYVVRDMPNDGTLLCHSHSVYMGPLYCYFTSHMATRLLLLDSNRLYICTR